ncbi:hypothetical protein UZ36_07010 [Candidatus Nitromaritima sp. SCGC AAA799-C22]|nr:hypothetical protein UZ36_07010 [Candidatus Nitromaritima sp. SCGC AAA799-C22]
MLKKFGSNQRPPNKNNGPRRGNSNSQQNKRSRTQTGDGANRNSSQGKRSHTPHLWTSTSSSGTLTSHLSMTNRRSQDGSGKNTNEKNSAGKSNGKPRGKFKSGQNGNNPNGAQGRSGHRSHTNRSHKAPYNTKRNAPAEKVQPNPSNKNQVPESKTNKFGIEAFELFCAYHLGIGPNNQYRPSNINEVANRFNLDTGTIRQILKEYGMDSASLLDRDFDLALAQLDIQVAPEGIDRKELARNIYEEFLNAPIQKRDWKKILEEDRKENAKVFGR